MKMKERAAYTRANDAFNAAAPPAVRATGDDNPGTFGDDRLQEYLH